MPEKDQGDKKVSIEKESPQPKAKTLTVAIWERFVTAVEGCGHSGYALAGETGLPMRTVQEYKPNKTPRAVPCYLLSAVADVLEWSPEQVWWILSGEGEPPPTASTSADE